MKVIIFCQCFCHLVLCYYQAAAVLWQVALGCWVRLACSCAGQGPQALLLGVVVTGGKRSLAGELLKDLTFGPAESYLNLWTVME